MAKVLVIGATGMLGRPIVVQLVLDGFDVRVLSTNLNKARAYFGEDVEYAEGNVGNRESQKAAMQGCDYVYVNLKGGPTVKDYIRIEEDGSRNIYYATAVETGIKKLVQISEARADERHEFFIAHKVKVAAEKALKAAGLIYVILKPTWFCESLPLMVRGNKATPVNLLAFFNKHDDSDVAGNPFDADALFGRSNTTLEEYARMYRKIAKGV